MNNKRLKELKNEYLKIDIPDELEYIVSREIKTVEIARKKRFNHRIITSIASIFVFALMINLNESFAQDLNEIPVLKGIVRVLSLSTYKDNKDGIEVNIDTPKIEGMENEELQYTLNEKFKDKGSYLYNEYMNEISKYKENNVKVNKSMEQWYEVKTDTQNILSIVVYTYYSEASSYTIGEYYTLNKENEEVLTLEGMFYGTDYVHLISEEIKKQMRVNMENDENNIYWIDGNNEFADGFETINEDQKFYINKNGELVICFDKYDVAPGSMGILEFVIDNDVIKTLL